MKIYVCYNNYGYDGMSRPEAAFDSEELAKLWKEGNHNGEYKAVKLHTLTGLLQTALANPQHSNKEAE